MKGSFIGSLGWALAVGVGFGQAAEPPAVTLGPASAASAPQPTISLAKPYAGSSVAPSGYTARAQNASPSTPYAPLSAHAAGKVTVTRPGTNPAIVRVQNDDKGPELLKKPTPAPSAPAIPTVPTVTVDPLGAGLTSSVLGGCATDCGTFGDLGAVPGSPGRGWFARAEYLLWAMKPDVTPVLATTGPPASRGFLGQPGTTVLFGGELDNGFRQGLRFTGGAWLDDCQRCGIDGSFFFLQPNYASANIAVPPGQVLARPIFALNPGIQGEFAELVSFPGLSEGSLAIRSASRLWGADVNCFETLGCGCDQRTSLFVGLRYLQLFEQLRITEFIVAGPDATNQPQGTFIVVTDGFQTRNQFYGAQVGADWRRQWGRVSADVRGKVAAGVTTQTLSIDGSQFVTRPDGTTSSFVGGLLTTPGNVGSFSRTQFSVVPEITTTVGLQVTDNLRIFAGYNALFWTNVIRPGTSIDRVVDTTLVPNFGGGIVAPTGQNRPAPTFNSQDFWVHGASAGLEFRW
jgi:hypothetical protein